MSNLSLTRLLLPLRVMSRTLSYDPPVLCFVKSMCSTEEVFTAIRFCGDSFQRPYTVTVYITRTRTKVLVSFLTCLVSLPYFIVVVQRLQIGIIVQATNYEYASSSLCCFTVYATTEVIKLLLMRCFSLNN